MDCGGACGLRWNRRGQAQDYPTRTVTVIVPFAAGGPADVMGRIASDILSRHLGQSFVVENVAGAGGTVGALRAARANPDGYTLISGHMGTNALAPVFYPNLGYDPEKDFEPVSLDRRAARTARGSQGHPRQQPERVRRLGQSEPEQAQHGACRRRLGVVYRLPSAQLAIGIKPTLVPFTGTAPVMNAILAGNVDYDCDPVLGPSQHVRKGTVKALAIAAKKRSPLLPDVPTSYEQGFPQFDCAPFYAVFAPKGTPKAVIDKLAAASAKAWTSPPCKSGWAISAPRSRNRTARAKSPGRAGAQRNRAADADPESRNCQMIALYVRYTPNRWGNRPAELVDS